MSATTAQPRQPQPSSQPFNAATPKEGGFVRIGKVTPNVNRNGVPKFVVPVAAF